MKTKLIANSYHGSSAQSLCRPNAAPAQSRSPRGETETNENNYLAPYSRCKWAAITCLLLVLGSPAQAPACTPVSGLVSGGTWTAANSPYCVVGDVQVFGTLTIEPNVTVRFDGNYEFQVGGRIHANGALFTPLNTTNCWKGIAFFDALPGSFFNNTIIEGACQSGVRITNTPPAFTNCIIRNNSSPTHGGGILADLSALPLVMVGCTISNNVADPYDFSGGRYGGGIYVDGPLLLVQSQVISNRTQGQVGYGGGVFAQNGDCTMRCCTIAFNAPHASVYDNADGVYYYSGAAGGTLLMANCTLATNGLVGSSSQYGGGGLWVEGRATLINCISVGNAHEGLRFYSGAASVVNCTVVGNANGFYGLYSDGASVRVTNSIIYFNNSGLGQFGGNITFAYSDVQGGVQPGPGNISFAPGLCPKQTLIQGSPCIDAGSPEPLFNDRCFDNSGLCTPYSRGTAANDMGAYGGPGACGWTGPCDGAPVITAPPKGLAACINSSAMFCVSAIGDEPHTYQWRFHGTNANYAPTNLPEATNACLLISDVQSNNAGYYSVLVANNFGTVVSSNALLLVTPVCVEINLYPGLTVTAGVVGKVYRVQCSTNVNDTNWTTFTTITQTVSGVFVLDPEPASKSRKFYRVLP